MHEKLLRKYMKAIMLLEDTSFLEHVAEDFTEAELEEMQRIEQSLWEEVICQDT